MRNSGWLVGLFFIAVSVNGLAATPTSTIEQLESTRQVLAQDSHIDLRLLSTDIQAAVRDSNALDQTGNDDNAIARLKVLDKYAPLAAFPSFDVQVQCDRLYTKLSLPSDAAACRDRATAMEEILQKRSGSGATFDDPVRVITINEIAEWARSQAAKISDVRTYPYHGEELQAIVYTSPSTAGKSVIAYFQYTPRLRAALNNASSDVFTPLPVSASDGKYQTALTQAREERVKFLNDLSFNYPELIQLCNDKIREALQLAQQGDFNGALSKLREVERVRPIQNIPIYGFIESYSFLLGKSGNLDAQQTARLYLFGIAQDIAHSGDGLTPGSAVHVVAISEESAWLRAKKKRLSRQSSISKGDHRFDVIDAIGEDGNTQTYYFEASQVFARESQVTR